MTADVRVSSCLTTTIHQLLLLLYNRGLQMFSLSEFLSNTITQKLFLSHNTEKKLNLFPTMWTEWTQFFPLGFSLSPSDSVDALLDARIELLPAESSANTHTRSDTYSHSEAVQPEAVLKVLRAGWFGVRIRISCCCLHENQLLQQVKLSAADRVSASCWTHNTCLCCRQDLQRVHNKFIISEASQWKTPHKVQCVCTSLCFEIHTDMIIIIWIF